MRFGKLAAFLLLGGAVAGCGTKGTPVTLTITPTSAFVVRTGTQQFAAQVAGINNTLVT